MTDECKVLKAQIEETRSIWEKGQSPKKPFSKDAKATVMSIVKKSVKASIHKILSNNSKKRKLNETNFNIEETSKKNVRPLTLKSLFVGAAPHVPSYVSMTGFLSQNHYRNDGRVIS